MSRVGKGFGLAGVTAVVLATATAALAADPITPAAPTTQEMAQQIQQLQTEVGQLQAAQTPAPAKDEAGSHSFDVNPLTADYDPAVGFVIRSDDGNFSFHPGIVVDF